MISHDVASDRELDLHEQTWREALPAFIEFYNQALLHADGDPVHTVDVIHGYGSSGAGGVLRKRLQNYLREQADRGRLEFAPGDHADGNPGHTIVLPIEALPGTHDMLAEDVLDYCARPRPLSKITGKFRRHGEPAVLATIDSLVRQRRLRPVSKGSRKAYEAI